LISLPCQGTLTNNRYGILLRVTGTNEVANNNKISNNTIMGCGNGATGDVGIKSTGISVTLDSNTFNDNKLVNLPVGYLISTGTNIFIRNTEYVNVTTEASLSGTLTFAEEDFGVPYADLTTCNGTSLLGKTAEVTNSTTATFGATVAAGGTNHILARCSQSGNWTVQGGP
jgi:hypothetical protein